MVAVLHIAVPCRACFACLKSCKSHRPFLAVRPHHLAKTRTVSALQARLLALPATLHPLTADNAGNRSALPPCPPLKPLLCSSAPTGPTYAWTTCPASPAVQLSADWSYACIDYVSSLRDPRNAATLAVYLLLLATLLLARPWRVLVQWAGKLPVGLMSRRVQQAAARCSYAAMRCST